MVDEIDQRLRSLETARHKLLKLIADSETEISAIENKITELKQRQKDRLKEDDRVDNNFVEQMAQGNMAKVEPTAKSAAYVEIFIDEDGNKVERVVE